MLFSFFRLFFTSHIYNYCLCWVSFRRDALSFSLSLFFSLSLSPPLLSLFLITLTLSNPPTTDSLTHAHSLVGVGNCSLS
jgi:hypothetical protein